MLKITNHFDFDMHISQLSHNYLTTIACLTISQHHLTTVRMASIKKATNNTYWRVCGEKRTLVHY